MPKISIIVPTCGHLEDHLKPCLESIKQYTDLSDTEVIVVANGCTDGTQQYVHSLGYPFRLLDNPGKIGYIKAVNQGVFSSSSEYVVLLNDDTQLLHQPHNQWINILLEPMQKEHPVGITGPMLIWREDIQRRFLMFFCVAIRREIFFRIGGLDETFGNGYHEDIDFCVRAENDGWKTMQVPVDMSWEQTKRGEYPQLAFPIYHKDNGSFSQDEKNLLQSKNTKLLHDRYLGIDACYETARRGPNDITDHLPILRKLAEECETVTEFGVRHVVATWALLAGRPKKYIGYDIDKSPNIRLAEEFARRENIDFSFNHQSVLEIEIQETDLLFIDTWHTYEQLQQELKLHAKKAKKYIAFHDTKTWGLKGEFSEKGLLPALHEFLANNPAWRVKEYRTDQNGFTVIERIETAPKFSIVIPTYNHLDDCLKPCLESIIKYTDLSNVEVIVVANGCTDGTRDYVMGLGGPFRLIWVDEPSGYTKSTNMGIVQSAGNYIILLNNDTVLLEQPKNDWINKLLDPMLANPKIGMTGPLALHDPYAQSRVIIFFCAMIKQEVFLQVGILDEVFSPGGGEDIDFTVRMEKAGWEWRQVPDHGPVQQTNINTGNFMIYHKGEGTFDEMPEYSLKIIKRNGLHNLKRYGKSIKLKINSLDWQSDPGFLTVHPAKMSHLDMPYDKLDFADKSVDSIIACDLVATEEMLTEWNRVLKGNGTYELRNSSIKTGKIYDCFPFFNELDILDIRLAELDSVVDFFVISELPVTHKGDPKPSYFLQNKERYAKYLHKIIHVFRDDYPRDADPWSRERFQRDICKEILQERCTDQDIVIVSDCDEIPRAEKVRQYKIGDGLQAFEQRLYSFYLNLDGGLDRQEPGVWSKIVPYAQFKEMSACQVRYTDSTGRTIKDGGWHFNYMGGPKAVVTKLESWAHQEWNDERFKNEEKILDALNKGSDPFGRGERFHYTAIDQTFPKYIIEHQQELIGKGFIYLETLVKSPKITSDTVTAYISTKNRYFTTLPLAIQAVISQIRKPEKLIIFDDGDHKDLREVAPYRHLFRMLDRSGIQWSVIFGKKLGQVANHQTAVDICDTEWLWRIDDDDVPEPDVLQRLLNTVKNYSDPDRVGAIGGLVLMPDQMFTIDKPHTQNSEGRYIPKAKPLLEFTNEGCCGCSPKIVDIYTHGNMQWAVNGSISEVEHLHNTFLYRKRASSHGYRNDLSPVGHREETIFTYEMVRNGWKLLVDPSVVTWHYRDQQGGIRSYEENSLWDHDETIFTELMKAWQGPVSKKKLFVLDSGMGDHYAFKIILDELKEQHPEGIALAVCYPEIFEDSGVDLLSIAQAKILDSNLDKYSVYKWMWDRQWRRSITEAYRRMYLNENSDNKSVLAKDEERKGKPQKLSLLV